MPVLRGSKRPSIAMLTWALSGLTAGFLAGLVLIAAVRHWTNNPPLHGTTFANSKPLADFALVNASGADVKLSEFDRDFLLLFFGYTNCPDICPATLAVLAQVQTMLAKETQAVQVVMITVDPEHDHPARIHDYARQFHPEFVGLGGDEARLAPLFSELGIYRERRQLANGQAFIDHTASVLLLDRERRIRVAYPFATPATDIHEDLLQLIEERPD